ncbi:MAG: hypothetical protein ABI616_05815 [Pseudomonadota bacterium]
MRKYSIVLLLTLFVGGANAANSTSCDRACLYGFVDQYLDALQHRDSTRLPWAGNARYTENNVQLPTGEGVWGTVTGLSSYKLRFADEKNGQVGVFGAISEADATSAFALRLKVVGKKINEAEMLVVRVKDFGALGEGPNPFANPKFDDKPILLQNLKPGEGRPRGKMIALADGYFSTLQLNDGKLHTEFDPACNRIENGLQTTNNPEKPLGPTSALGCAEQFRLGVYRYDDRLRDRRYPLVDEERGIVLSSGFIDHSGKLGEYKYTDGTAAVSVIRHPHSFYFIELFKIVDGKIRQVEATFITVPYSMPSPWKQ